MSRLQDENDDKVADKEENSEEGSEGNNPVAEHSEIDNRTCQICNKMFYTRGNMKAHVKYHHEMKGRLACQSCDKSYSSKAGLAYHTRRDHSNGTEIKCEKCDVRFQDFKDYATHRRSHKSATFQLEQKCKKCDKIIRGKWNLNQHKKDIHGIENKFNTNKVTVKIYSHSCDTFSAVFKRNNDLKCHVRAVHKGVRMSCDICNKEFQYKQNLRRHMKTVHK